MFSVVKGIREAKHDLSVVPAVKGKQSNPGLLFDLIAFTHPFFSCKPICLLCRYSSIVSMFQELNLWFPGFGGSTRVSSKTGLHCKVD